MDTPRRDDFELLDAWRANDEAAGRELFERYFDQVYRFFRNKVDEAAEDLVQQTFMGLVQGRDRFRKDASFRTYVFMIARKRLYSFLRERDRAHDPVDDGTTSVADLGLVSPSRAVVVRQEQHLLLAALRKLPIEMQVALELYYWEDLTAGEIATVLGVPEGTVRSRLRLGRDRLREQLGTLDGRLAEALDIEARARAAREGAR